jgi:phosphotransferase system IIA component
MRERLDQCEATVWPDNRTIYERVAGGHADVFVSDNIEVLLHVGMDPRLCGA